MMTLRKVSFVVLVCGVGLAMSGCREAEQNRPLLHDKGKYGGKADEKLDQKLVNDLQHRGRYQSFN